MLSKKIPSAPGRAGRKEEIQRCLMPDGMRLRVTKMGRGGGTKGKVAVGSMVKPTVRPKKMFTGSRLFRVYLEMELFGLSGHESRPV